MPIIPYIGVIFPFMELLSFLFLGDLEVNANIFVAIKSGFTVRIANIITTASIVTILSVRRRASIFTTL